MGKTCILAIITVIVAICRTLCPVETTNTVDVYAYELEPSGGEKAEGNASSATVIVGYVLKLHTQSELVELYYQNPYTSQSSVKLALYVDDTLIAQSGLIPAGYGLSRMDKAAEAELEPGTYSAFLQTVFIDPATGSEIDFNSGINVQLKVCDD